jgi:hypothetical protein
MIPPPTHRRLAVALAALAAATSCSSVPVSVDEAARQSTPATAVVGSAPVLDGFPAPGASDVDSLMRSTFGWPDDAYPIPSDAVLHRYDVTTFSESEFRQAGGQWVIAWTEPRRSVDAIGLASDLGWEMTENKAGRLTGDPDSPMYRAYRFAREGDAYSDMQVLTTPLGNETFVSVGLATSFDQGVDISGSGYGWAAVHAAPDYAELSSITVKTVPEDVQPYELSNGWEADLFFHVPVDRFEESWSFFGTEDNLPADYRIVSAPETPVFQDSTIHLRGPDGIALRVDLPTNTAMEEGLVRVGYEVPFS